MKTVLAIDPGPEQSAFVLWDGKRIVLAEHIDNSTGLLKFEAIIVDVVAIERLKSYGMPVGQSVLETCYWSGCFAAAFVRRDVLERPYYSDVASHHCNHPRAKSSAIKRALKDKYGEKGTKKAPGLTYSLVGDHLWDAFAIATMFEPGPA